MFAEYVNRPRQADRGSGDGPSRTWRCSEGPLRVATEVAGVGIEVDVPMDGDAQPAQPRSAGGAPMTGIGERAGDVSGGSMTREGEADDQPVY